MSKQNRSGKRKAGNSNRTQTRRSSSPDDLRGIDKGKSREKIEYEDGGGGGSSSDAIIRRRKSGENSSFSNIDSTVPPILLRAPPLQWPHAAPPPPPVNYDSSISLPSTMQRSRLSVAEEELLAYSMYSAGQENSSLQAQATFPIATPTTSDYSNVSALVLSDSLLMYGDPSQDNFAVSNLPLSSTQTAPHRQQRLSWLPLPSASVSSETPGQLPSIASSYPGVFSSPDTLPIDFFEQGYIDDSTPLSSFYSSSVPTMTTTPQPYPLPFSSDLTPLYSEAGPSSLGSQPQALPCEDQSRDQESGERVPACDFCRKRKVKCDRQQPTCGFCARMGIPCTTDDQLKRRGPLSRAQKTVMYQAGLVYDRNRRRWRRIGQDESVVLDRSINEQGDQQSRQRRRQGSLPEVSISEDHPPILKHSKSAS